MRRAAAAAAAPLLLGALTLLLYAPVRGLFFTKDDPAILAHVVERGLLADFTSPEAWQSHNRLFFTPLLNASLAADLSLAGLRAGPFYAHHLAALLLAALLLQRVLAREVPAAIATVSAALFLAGAPVAEVATQLMSRHYVEGLALSLAAVLAWRVPDEARSRGRDAVAALLCVLAGAAKEVYLPLPLFLLLVTPPGRRRDPARLALLGAALAVGLGWRFAMLGAVGRSYAPDQLGPAALLSNAGALAAALPAALFGLGRPVSFALLAVLLALSLAWVVGRGRPGVAAGAAVLFAAPILPVAAWVGIGGRYVLVGWALLVTLAALSAGALRDRGPSGRAGAAVILVALAAGSLPGGRARFERSLAEAARESAEGRFFLSSGNGDLLLDPAAPPWYFRGLAALRAAFGPAGSPGAVANDPIALCGEAGAAARVFVSRAAGAPTPASGEEAAARSAACRGIVEAPLGGAVSFDRGLLEWTLGPPREGSWGIVFLVPAYRFDVPPAGRHYLQWPPFGAELALRLRHVSTSGIATYGPELRARLSDGRARVEGGAP